MKYLQNPSLELLSRQLNGSHISPNNAAEIISGLSNSNSNNSVNCRLEAYSCKMTTNDKREYKKIAKEPGRKPSLVHEALAPPQHGSIEIENCTEIIGKSPLAGSSSLGVTLGQT